LADGDLPLLSENHARKRLCFGNPPVGQHDETPIRVENAPTEFTNAIRNGGIRKAVKTVLMCLQHIDPTWTPSGDGCRIDVVIGGQRQHHRPAALRNLANDCGFV
jgi:hypothetical protein